ncbi:far upstream element-binding protein 2-like isoform 2-T2 [Menidia menidia]
MPDMSEYNAVTPPGSAAPSGGGQAALGNGDGGIKKDAFADAVQRARQIAAKIGGDSGPALTHTAALDGFPFTGQKRQLEDADEPESKKLASQSDLESAKALSISTQLAALAQPRPTSTSEEYSVPDSMVGLIIGRGGEQINKIQQESGCKVQIAPDSGGLPERSVSLSGSIDSIQKAKRLLDDIVSRGRGTPPSSYHESTNGQNGTVHEMMIPAGKAGLVIGKGGETIKQLQERAGVKMILIQDASQGPNIDKPLRIIGDPYKVQQAQEMVEEILRDRDQGGFSERTEFSSRMGGGMDISVPRHSVGVVIGRNGDMIKKIQNDAGVRIQFKQDDGTGPDKIAHISGPPDCCEHASQIINDLLQSIRFREEGQGGPPGPPGTPAGSRGRSGGQDCWGPPGGEMTFSIPAHQCGLVIGRGGENVKSINQQTGAFVEISQQLPPNGDPNFKLFIIRGSPQQIDHAKQLVEEKIEGQVDEVDLVLVVQWVLTTLIHTTLVTLGLLDHPMVVLQALTNTPLQAGATPTSSGSRSHPVTPARQQPMTPMQPGRRTMPSTTSSHQGLCQRSTPQTQLEVPKLQGIKPRPPRHRGDIQIIPRPGRITTRKWLRQVAQPLGQQLQLQQGEQHPQGRVSQTTAPPGQSTTGSRPHTMARQDRDPTSQSPLSLDRCSDSSWQRV